MVPRRLFPACGSVHQVCDLVASGGRMLLADYRPDSCLTGRVSVNGL